MVWHGEDMASIRSHVSWLSVSEALATAAALGNDSLRVLDIGGGAGVDAVRVARESHEVTVVDQSSDALAALQQRAREAQVEIRAIQGDGESLQPTMFTSAFDVALCHGVIETVAQPLILLKSIASVLKPGGLISVQVPGLIAAVKHRVSLGDLDLARALYEADVSTWDVETLGPRRYRWDELGDLVAAAGFSVVGLRGVRVFGDSVAADVTDDDPDRFEVLLELEQRLKSDREFAAGSAGLQALGRLD